MSLTIHHLQVSQSERLVWLAEELNLEYNLTIHKRAPVFSPDSIKALHPLGQAPIIQDGPLTLAESAACAEYIIHKHGGGRLALGPSHPDYADYLYWFHFANGNLQHQILRLMQVKAAAGPDAAGNTVVKRTEQSLHKALAFMDDRLRDRQWLAGSEFTAADVMTVFSLTTMRAFEPLDLTEYGSVLAWLGRATGREAYRRARTKGDPELEAMVEGRPPGSFVARLRAEGKL